MIDTNDNPPKISVNSILSKTPGISEEMVGWLSEDASQKTLVAHISVRDSDSGMNGHFECELREVVDGYESKSENFLLLITSAGDFRLVTAHSNFDRETKKRFVVF